MNSTNSTIAAAALETCTVSDVHRFNACFGTPYLCVMSALLVMDGTMAMAATANLVMLLRSRPLKGLCNETVKTAQRFFLFFLSACRPVASPFN